MRPFVPVALAVALCGAPALAQPKARTTPRAKPPAAATAPKSSSKSFSFSFGTSRARLGAQVTSMTEELRDFFGAPKDSGVLVQKVEPSTPAAKAGIRVGDVLTRVDGKPIEDPFDVSSALSGKKSGDLVIVGVVRNRRYQQLTAKLDADASDDFDFDFSLDGLGDLWKSFGQGKTHRFHKQWSWQWGN